MGKPVDARAIGDILVDRLGERVRLLEHHADARAKLHHVHRRRIDILAVERDLAGRRALAIVSFIRLSVRRKVDLPQPDGPMNAVTLSMSTSIDTSLIACLSP
jgi:hypothetical protein